MVVSCHYISCPWLKRQRERERETEFSTCSGTVLDQSSRMDAHTHGRAVFAQERNQTHNRFEKDPPLPIPSFPFPPAMPTTTIFLSVSPLPCLLFGQQRKSLLAKTNTHTHTPVLESLRILPPERSWLPSWLPSVRLVVVTFVSFQRDRRDMDGVVKTNTRLC